MGKRTLAGAALASHLAKRRGRRSEMPGIVGLMARLDEEFPVNKPMEIGDVVVEQFPTVEEVDGRVPWDGFHSADGNFTGIGEPVGEPIVEIDVPVRLVDARLDNEAAEGGKSWDVLVARYARRDARRARKMAGVQKELQKAKDDHLAARFAAVLAARHEEFTAAKRDYIERIARGEMPPLGKKGLARLTFDVLSGPSSLQPAIQRSSVAL